MGTKEALRLAERYDSSINGLEADAIARLNASLDASYRALEKDLREAYAKMQTQGGLVVSQQKLLIANELGQTIDLVNPGNEEAYQNTLEDLLQETSATGSLMADELVQAIDSDFGLAAFTRIPIEAVALQARDGLDRLKRHSNDFKENANAIVQQGLIQGWGPQRVAGVLRRQLGTTKGQAENIARTEVSSALNDAAKQRYRANGVDYFQLVVTPSEGLCPYCADRNGKVYKLNDVRVPLHGRCRCMVLPWSLKWEELGLTDDEFMASYREQNLAALKADGQKPNNGPTYWERKAGLKKAPKAFRTPGEKRASTKKNRRKSRKKKKAAAPAPVAIPKPKNEAEVVTYYRRRQAENEAKLKKLPPSESWRIDSLERQILRARERGERTNSLTRDLNRLKKKERQREDAIQERIKIRADLKADLKKYLQKNQADNVVGGWHGMGELEDMQVSTFNGLTVQEAGGFEMSEISLVDLVLEGWPPKRMTKSTHTLIFSAQRNKSDAYWEKKYGKKDFVSAATGGDGKVVVYNGSPASARTLRHEMGHNFARTVYGTTSPPEGSDFRAAAEADGKSLTDYGQVAIAEDFAETVAIYLETSKKSHNFDAKDLKRESPNRYAVMEKLLGNDGGN